MHLRQILFTASFLILISGCSDGSGTATDNKEAGQTQKGKAASSSNENSSDQNPATMENVKQKLRDASEATGEYASQAMKDYSEALNEKMDNLDTQLADLKKKGQDLAGEAKEQWQAQMKKLEDKREKLQQDLGKLRDASGEAWQEMKVGLDAAWKDLKGAADKAAKEFNQ